jgi:hypothetical protein
MDKYTRTEIKYYTKENSYTSHCEVYINKWMCQVNINCRHPEYLRRIENDENTTVCILVGDSWEEVNNKFKEMNKEKE